MARSLGRDFGRLWRSAALSNFGDGIVLLAAMLVAGRLTDSASLVAGVMVSYSLPQALGALPVGVLADRADRRTLIAAANAARAVTLLVAVGAAAGGWLTLVVLYLVVAVLGLCEVVADTTAQSVIPALVPRADLGAANGRLYGTQVVAGEFVGAPLAGVLVALTAVAAFAVPAVLYAAAGVAMLAVTGLGGRPERREAAVRTDIAEGVRYLAGHAVLRRFAVMSGTLNLGNAAFFAVFVLFAVGPGSAMGLSESAYGLLITAVAVGAVLGSVVADRLATRLGEVRVLVGALWAVALAYGLPVLTARTWVVAVAFALAGFAGMSANIILSSTRQRLVPGALLGRVNATYRLVALGTLPLGALLGGAVGDLLGLRAVFAMAAALFLAGLPLLRGLTDLALRGAPDPMTDERMDHGDH